MREKASKSAAAREISEAPPDGKSVYLQEPAVNRKEALGADSEHCQLLRGSQPTVLSTLQRDYYYPIKSERKH
jgi:hypothetical protein